MTVYRIGNAKYPSNDGEGAKLFGGRWNHKAMQDEVQGGFGLRVMARHDTRELRDRQVAVVWGGACGHSTSGACIGAGMMSGEVWREADKASVSRVYRKLQSVADGRKRHAL